MVRVRTKMVMVMMAMRMTVELPIVMTVKMVVMGKIATMVLMEMLQFQSILDIQVAHKTRRTKITQVILLRHRNVHVC